MATTAEIPHAYKIILSDDPDELATAVEESMVKGWIPQGGVAIAFDMRQAVKDGKVPCAQAMVQYRQLPPTEV